MNKGSIFDKLQAEAFRNNIQIRSKESREWFKKKVSALRSLTPESILEDERLTQRKRVGPGQMFMYTYDPKHKETLPYYDKFPLIIMIEKAPKGYYGLNLHYLPLPLRAKLFDELLNTLNNQKYNQRTKFVLSYQILKNAERLKAFAPCFKRYLTKHVRSNIVKVEPTEWEIALFLPVERFEKQTKEFVWNESRRIIKGIKK